MGDSWQADLVVLVRWDQARDPGGVSATHRGGAPTSAGTLERVHGLVGLGLAGRGVHGLAPTSAGMLERVHGVGLAGRGRRRPGRRRVSSSLGPSTTLRLPSWPHQTPVRYRCRVCWCYHVTWRIRWCGLMVVGWGVVWCRVGGLHRMCGMHV